MNFCDGAKDVMSCGCYVFASVCCSADFADEWAHSWCECCLPSKVSDTAVPFGPRVSSRRAESAKPTGNSPDLPPLVSTPAPAPSASATSPPHHAKWPTSPIGPDEIHASLDDLFPALQGEHDRQLRVLKAQTLCTTLPSFAATQIARSAAGTGKHSSAPEVEPELVVPTMRDEMIYDLVGTTFGVCKMCFADAKTLKLDPCGHMLCRFCKDAWDSKVTLHGAKLDLPAEALAAESVCPFCHAGVIAATPIVVTDRPAGTVPGPSHAPTGGVWMAQPKSMSLLSTCTSIPAASLSAAMFAAPVTWAPVAEEEYASEIVKVFPLQLEKEEAGAVIADFLGSLINDVKIDVAKVNVLSVKRIQNWALYQSFCCARQTMIARHLHRKRPNQTAQTRSVAVWEAKADSGWTEYPADVASQIEKAYRAFTVRGGPADCKVTLSLGGTYRVDFDSGDSSHPGPWKHTQTSDRHGTTRSVRRWAPYTDHQVEATDENLAAAVERKLYHGTSATASQKIIQQGFNRSFAGVHGTAFGNGVYFARDAGYAANPTYSRPDRWGIKRVLLCRVLIGESCRGWSGQKVPDVYDHTTGRLHDSTVDNVADPSIYVTFADSQAYPEYSIEFEFTP